MPSIIFSWLKCAAANVYLVLELFIQNLMLVKSISYKHQGVHPLSTKETISSQTDTFSFIQFCIKKYVYCILFRL